MFDLKGVKTIIILLKWNAQGKGMILIGFLPSGLIVFRRLGFRIVSRTIKRGSQVSNLIIFFRETHTLHSWHHLSWFLYGFYPCEVLELVVILMKISSSS
jgi:hypothetical protein